MKKAASFLSLCMVFMLALFFTGTQARAEGSGGYVGPNVCKKCHPYEYGTYETSIHAKKTIANTPANNQDCETCHGAGAQHVAKGGGIGVSIFAFNKEHTAKEKAAKCLACHAQSKWAAFWSQGKHAREGLACTDCHSMHNGGWNYLKGVTGKYDVYNLCFRCHKDVRNMVNKQSHHPILEGKVSCVDCHNPHGTFNRRMLRADSVNELCYKCHPEKRGPFMNEHPPVEESCLTCHTPHGSNNNKLQVAQITVLCERCHIDGGHQNGPFTTFQSFNPPTKGISNQFASPRVVGRMCTNCHTNIHGSNFPGELGQTFIR